MSSYALIGRKIRFASPPTAEPREGSVRALVWGPDGLGYLRIDTESFRCAEVHVLEDLGPADAPDPAAVPGPLAPAPEAPARSAAHARLRKTVGRTEPVQHNPARVATEEDFVQSGETRGGGTP